MGLDNGVVVKFKYKGKYLHIPNEILHNVEWSYMTPEKIRINEDSFKEEPCLNCELVYWRKWWGPRDEVMRVFRSKYNFEDEPYTINLDREDLQSIIEVLQDFNSAENWTDDGGSPVWAYEEDGIKEQIDADIQTLKDLRRFMKTDLYKEMTERDEIEVYFYDSY